MTPGWLRSSRALAILSTIGVAMSLAGAAASIITRALGQPFFADLKHPSWPIAVPTFVLGTAWVACLRWRSFVGGSRLRIGWVLSVPLAAMNAGVACSIVAAGSALSTFVLGVLVGAIVWVPALLATLVCFGGPIAWAQNAAARGLVGEERGEAVVGLATVVVGLLGTVVYTDRFALSVSIFGLCLGITTALSALVRDRRRARFVSAVAAGEVHGFRVESSRRGRVLIRLSTNGNVYRVGSIDEEVFEIERSTAVMRRSAEA
jgi:hypothetical protein